MSLATACLSDPSRKGPKSTVWIAPENGLGEVCAIVDNVMGAQWVIASCKRDSWRASRPDDMRPGPGEPAGAPSRALLVRTPHCASKSGFAFRVKLQTFTLIQYKTTQSQFSELGAASDVLSGILSFIMQLGCKESCTLADGCRNFEKVLGACLSFIFPASNLFSQIYA